MKIEKGRRAALATGIVAILILALAAIASGDKLSRWLSRWKDRVREDRIRGILESRKLSISAPGNPLERVLDSFSRSTGVPFIADPEAGVGGIPVALSLRDARAIDALRLVLSLTGLGCTVRDGAVLVTERRRAEPPFLRVRER